MDPQDVTALAAALEVAFGARREQQYCTRRGGRRVNAVRNGGAPSRNRGLDVTDHILAARLRSHLNLPTRAIGVLPGVDPATISHATSLTAGSSPAPASRCHPPSRRQPSSPAHPAGLLALRRSGRQYPHHPGKRPGHARPLQTTPATARDTPETANLKTDAAILPENSPVEAIRAAGSQ